MRRRPDRPCGGAFGFPRPLPPRVVVAILVVLLAVAGALRSAASSVGGDFLRYHRAGRLVATGNADRLYDAEWLRGQKVYAEERKAERAERGRDAERYFEEEFKYLPATAVLMAPFGALHPRTAWVLWGAWNGAMIAITFAAAWAFAVRGAPLRWALVGALILLRVAGDNQNLGQLNPSAIAPATVALWALDRGRDRAAGASAALGAVVKFLPVLLAIWFAVKRRWVAAAVTVAGFAVVAAALPALVLGPSRTVDLTREYFSIRTTVYTGAAPDDVPGHSVKSFVYRVFGGVPMRTNRGGKGTEVDVSVMRADPETLRLAVNVVNLLLLAAVCVLAWGPLRGGGDPRGPPEAGLFVCWMLLASPEARAPHFLYLAIPLAALLAGAWRMRRDARPGAAVALTLAVAGGLLLQGESSSLLGRDTSNVLSALCVQGFATLAIGAGLAVVLRATPASSPGSPAPR